MVGIDHCGRYINSAMQIQKDGRLKFGSGKEAKIPDGIDAKKVTFLQVYFNDIFCPVLMFISS